jgi:hypothetical protein
MYIEVQQNSDAKIVKSLNTQKPLANINTRISEDCCKVKLINSPLHLKDQKQAKIRLLSSRKGDRSPPVSDNS